MACLYASPASAQGTAAGTLIDNKATATYDGPGGTPTTIDSNTVSLKVDELLNVTVASGDSGDIAAKPGDTNRVLSFIVTNSGNGPEAFKLTADANVGGDDFNPTVTSIVLDTNNNNVYDAGTDTVYTQGSNDPLLAPDARIRIFVLATIPGGATDGQHGIVTLTAQAKTGNGAAGTTFAGQGENGGDAIVGATTALQSANGRYAVSQAVVALTKSAVVLDPFGNSGQVPGAVITYTLTATVSGSGSVTNLRISDTIPTGTTYQTGSIKLDGSALTDVSDADAGTFSGNAVAVMLGTVAAGSPAKIVTFKVKID